MSRTSSILFIGGHDPSGGAGLHADIETAFAHGCRSYSLITCLTTQNTENVLAIHPQNTQDFSTQFDLLLNDIQPDIVKIGLIGDSKLAATIAIKLAQVNKPIVLDPVLAAGGGLNLSSEKLLTTIREQLLPITTLLTPNRAEARRLGNSDSTELATRALLSSGCQHVLLTGADETLTKEVTNTLFSGLETSTDFHYSLLAHSYHGSGCTLASACACNLILGKDMHQAVSDAQDFAWQSLKNAERPGKGQHLPKRQ